MPREHLVIELFHQQYATEPCIVCHAPGRVNLIGDHTDYNDGFVLPAAINFGTDIAALPRNDSIVRVYAHDCDQQVAEFSLNDIAFNKQHMWANYVAGTLKVLQESYSHIRGVDMVVSGNVPQGAGLSSSASFEIAVLKTFVELYQLDLDGLQAALIGQKAENTFVGCNCGIMDQLISAMGKKDHAMLLDCRNLSFEDAPVPDGMSLFIVNSNVKRGLVDSEYNLRRQQCEQVASFFDKKALRDVTLEQLQSAEHLLDSVLYKRARHVVTENSRTKQALSALQNNDIRLLSTLMRDSHVSLRDDFAVTTPEIDGLVALIDNELSDKGGVRMTGGGFGGCVVALLPEDMVKTISEKVALEYPQKYGLTPDIYICNASQGAFRAL